MIELRAAAILLHLLFAVVWVGGMFFAHFVLRPTALSVLEGPQRLRLWTGVFSRFFPWVWVAALGLPLTGFYLIFDLYGGFAGLHWSMHVMSGTGLLMLTLFMVLYAGPYQRLKREVAAQNWPTAARALELVRRIIITNLSLGLFTVAIAAGGRFL